MNGSQIVVGVDGADAFAEFQRLVQTALKAGESIESAMKKGSSAFDKLGTTGELSTRKLERAAKNYEQQLARQNTLVESGGQKNAAYFEAEAKRRGILTAAVQKQIDAMKALEAAQASANRAAGISAGQQAAAMRMLPAQMTDIVTGLATGQSPFMVLMQQGGQLKDMFGGIVPAAKAVGGALVGMVANPAVLATAAVAGLAYKMYEGAEQAREYQKAIVLAGDRAGVTADALLAMTHTVGAATGSYGLAKDALLEMAKSGAIASGDFERMGTTIVQMSQASGRAVSELVAELTKIKDDPLKAVVELSAKYRTMTGDIYAQVRALQEQGRHMEAVRLVQQQYADESDAMSKRVTDNLGYIEKAWRGIKGVAADAIADMERWGRADSLGERITDLRKQIAEQEKAAKEIGWSDSRLNENDTYNKRRAELADLMRQLAGQQAQAAIEKDAAAARERSVKAQEWLSKEAVSAASDREKHLARLKEIEDQRVAALKTATTELAKQQAIQNAAKLVAKENADYAEKQAETLKKTARFLAPYDGNFAIGKKRVGMRFHPAEKEWKYHSGVDVAMPAGTQLKAMADAVVKSIQTLPKAGKQVELEFANGYRAFYLHMSEFAKGLKEGQRVSAGQVIGKSGNTGVGTGAHLHLTLKDSGGNDVDFTKHIGREVKASYEEVRDLANGRLGQLHAETQLLGAKSEFEREAMRIQQGAYGLISEAQKQQILDAAKLKDAREAQLKQDEERIENERRYQEALALSTAAMERQLAVAAARYAADLEGMGKGNKWRERAASEQQINSNYQGMRNAASDDLLTGRLTQSQYEGKLQAIDEANQRELEMDRAHYQQKSILQADWATGAKEALNNYADTVANVAQSTEQMFTNAFKGMEDALVQFVTTGKLDFKSLANSIISDMARIAIQQSITGPLAGWFGSLFGGGTPAIGSAGSFNLTTGFVSALGNVYNTPDISAFSGQIVSSPTWFGGPGPMRAYATGGNLMGEAGPEAILPLKRGPGGYLGVRAEGGGTTNVSIVINTDGRSKSNASGPKEDQMGQFGKMLEGAVMGIIHREQRPGGALA